MPGRTLPVPPDRGGARRTAPEVPDRFGGRTVPPDERVPDEGRATLPPLEVGARRITVPPPRVVVEGPTRV
ncbi:MAG TPA: hypothetical protein VKU85_19675, partial [bacterium]|nr:hypothetical protein [bacterium]